MQSMRVYSEQMEACIHAGLGGVGGCWELWASKRTRHSNPHSHNAATCPSGQKAGTQHRAIASLWDCQTKLISAPVSSVEEQGGNVGWLWKNLNAREFQFALDHPIKLLSGNVTFLNNYRSEIRCISCQEMGNGIEYKPLLSHVIKTQKLNGNYHSHRSLTDCHEQIRYGQEMFEGL